MPPEAAVRATAELAARLRARFGERVVWVRLYGSQARGEATEGSDVDVAAVVRDLTWAAKVGSVELACDVALGCGLAISAMVTSKRDFARPLELESRYAENILAEGVAA